MAHKLHVVLFRPRIPPNTGTIGRNCVGLGARLHLIKPFGFDLGDDRALKRAGLDYWKDVDLEVYENMEEFFERTLPTFDLAVFFSKKEKYGSTLLADFKFPRDPVPENLALMFGNETQGIDFVPSEVVEAHPRVYLPMRPQIRSYNLSNVASVAMFEAVRQLPEMLPDDIVE